MTRSVLAGLETWSRVAIASGLKLDDRPRVGRPVLPCARRVPPSPAGTHIGLAIRAWRQAIGWSRAYLAWRVGCSVNALIEWERGKRAPRRSWMPAFIALGFVPPARPAPCVMQEAA